MSTSQQSSTLVVGKDGDFGARTQSNSDTSTILNETLRGHYVGPYPVDAFLDEYMPATAKSWDKTHFDGLDFSGVCNVTLEKAMYEPFVNIVHSFLPKNAQLTISAEERPNTSALRPDVGLRVFPKATQSRLVREGRKITREPFDFTRTDLCIELKLHTDNDPFVDDLSRLTVENNSDKGTQSRGQLAHYALEQFAQQHRCHLFQLIVFGNLARILYWDRSGAIVTERFNYVEKPQLLATFLWRYTRTTDLVRGLDPTVTVATEDEGALFREVVCEFIQTRKGKTSGRVGLPWAYITLDEGYPICQVQVRNSDAHRAFFISRAFYLAPGPCGRCTRAFLACDIWERKTFILKDTWEARDSTCLGEWSAYDILERESVPALLPRICGGEVLGNSGQQLTTVQDLSKQSHTWRAPCSPSLRTYGHFRLVQDVAYPVQCLRNSRELIKVFSDVAKCIATAEKAGVLHRDISIGNILFVRSELGVEGVLNDWDHAQQAQQQVSAQASFRSATRQFLSVSLLEHPEKPHEVVDDLQSLFWVLIFAALHYIAHDNNSFLRLNHLFSAERPPTINPSGSDIDSIAEKKRTTLRHSFLENIRFRCTKFKELTVALCSDWNEYLQSSLMAAEYDELRPRFEKIRGKVSCASSLATLLDNYLTNAGWEDDDVVPDQFPPMTTKQEKKYIAQQLTSTFSTSHLPERILSKAASTTGGQLAQRFGVAVAMQSLESMPPPQTGKRLHEVSDDSGEENEYKEGVPPRKRVKLNAPGARAQKRLKQHATRSLAPKPPPSHPCKRGD